MRKEDSLYVLMKERWTGYYLQSAILWEGLRFRFKGINLQRGIRMTSLEWTKKDPRPHAKVFEWNFFVKGLLQKIRLWQVKNDDKTKRDIELGLLRGYNCFGVITNCVIRGEVFLSSSHPCCFYYTHFLFEVQKINISKKRKMENQRIYLFLQIIILQEF